MTSRLLADGKPKRSVRPPGEMQVKRERMEAALTYLIGEYGLERVLLDDWWRGAKDEIDLDPEDLEMSRRSCLMHAVATKHAEYLLKVWHRRKEIPAILAGEVSP
jgi:hypothetical protein